MVYAVACPLSHGFCALGELGKVSPTLNPASQKLCVCQIGDPSITVIWHDNLLQITVVHTKQTTGCPHETEVSCCHLSNTFSLWSACRQARSVVHAAVVRDTSACMLKMYFKW